MTNTEQSDTSAEQAEPKFVDLALSNDGQRTGGTKRVQVRMPSDTQMMWFEATFYRFNLAMDAWKAGGSFGEAERGELYNDILDAVNVFVAAVHDREWISRAMARGLLEFDAIIEGIEAATRVLDLNTGQSSGAAGGADVVVE